MLRPVELLALLYGSDLEVSPADEDVYVRALPRPVTQTSSRISLHSLFGERLWPDFRRLERCRYGLRTLLVKVAQGCCDDTYMQEPNRDTVTIYGAAFWSLRVRM